MSNLNREHLIKVLKEKYDYELDRKKFYESILNVPITLLGFLIAGFFYLLKTPNTSTWFHAIMPIFCYDLLISILLTVYFVFKVYFEHNREYKSFPGSSDVTADYDNIANYETFRGESHSLQSRIDDRFQTFLIEWYIEINEHNTQINDRRGTSFYYTKLCLSFCFLSAIILFTLLVSNQLI